MNTPSRLRPLLAAGVALCLCASALPARAWSSSTTQVSSVAVFADGHVIVRFSEWTGTNACGSDYFSLGLPGSAQQRAMHAIALTALSAGKTVVVQTAAGVCNGGQELVHFLQVNW